MNGPIDRCKGLSILGLVTALATVIPVVYVVARRCLRSSRLQLQYTSSQFILAAGAVPFQFDTAGVPKRVLLVHHAPLDAWLLAKGRKDQGEDLATTAIREVHEETGYPCRLHTVPRIPTCAPLPTALTDAGFQPHSARMADNSTEPFFITFRPIGLDKLKLIFWYIGAVDVPYEEGEPRPSYAPGSHQLAEGFDQVRLVNVDDAIHQLAFAGDRDIVRTAISILTQPATST